MGCVLARCVVGVKLAAACQAFKALAAREVCGSEHMQEVGFDGRLVDHVESAQPFDGPRLVVGGGEQRVDRDEPYLRRRVIGSEGDRRRDRR